MNAQEYESKLRNLLWPLSKRDRDEAISFYVEAIADRVDDGAAEDEAVACMPTPEEAAEAVLLSREIDPSEEDDPGYCSETLMEFSIKSGEQDGERIPFRERIRQRKLSALEWIALAVTSPIWLSVLIAAFVVVLGVIVVALALYLCAWIVIAGVWIIGASLVIAAPATIVFAIWGIQTGNVPYALVNVGYGLFVFGCGAWVLRGALQISRMFLRWQKRNVSVAVESYGKKTYLVGSSIEEEEGYAQDGSSGQAGVGEEVVERSTCGKKGSLSGRTLFFRICLVALVAGIACVLIGFIASGFDWRVFLTPFFEGGEMYLGGMRVIDTDALLFGGFYFI